MKTTLITTAIAMALMVAAPAAIAQDAGGPKIISIHRGSAISARSESTSRADSRSSATAGGGNASVTIEAERQFTPDDCPQTLQHCQILAEADALWAMGLREEARLHLLHIPTVAGTVSETRRRITNN